MAEGLNHATDGGGGGAVQYFIRANKSQGRDSAQMAHLKWLAVND